ncbi:MAG: cytochrome c oxidase accessory protein CcoG [Bacteroidota bacterium]|jgi:cytochrome c oxidase accessory protein FixG|nr:cytochrome c oxidase accessory protein CcoG [Bacteroidota bacterium]
MSAHDPAEVEEKAEVTFRDRIATVSEEGKRNWIYPKKPSGRFYTWRNILGIFLLGFLVLAPFVKINGEQLLLLNVLERKFVVFGITFWPQDFHLFVLLMIAAVVFIFLFTAVYGRIFCGWICPQTIFMELVFRRIEYLIEGDAQQQRALNAAPWTAGKILKKVSKQAIFYGISFFISNLFLAYVIGSDALLKIISEPPSAHLSGFIAIVLFSGAFYFVFAWFREQVCVLVCPYGRLQGVLLDENSVVISYDFTRGEQRQKFRRDEQRSGGDCIDCHQCVVVCPTGIDIRNGTQLECINCTACIDACDSVMDKVGFPRGLIRYASSNAIVSGSKKIFTPRVIAYTAVLTVIIAVLVFLFASRSDVETTVLRAPGTLYLEPAAGTIRNLFTIRIVNKTREPLPIRIALLEPDGTLELVGGGALSVGASALAESAFFIDIDADHLDGLKTDILLGIYSGDRLIETVETGFMGPNK